MNLNTETHFPDEEYPTLLSYNLHMFYVFRTIILPNQTK
ncbi:uncharacterized protein METZ01_LOCUS435928 [marine metagenome]|uniref:Uncharacterized protein n=1 Tax=marine metagenome TaxID=408172 RepID=A0A382YIN1_9ZZZZ